MDAVNIMIQVAIWLGSMAVVAAGPGDHLAAWATLMVVETLWAVKFYKHPLSRSNPVSVALSVVEIVLWIAAWRSGWSPDLLGPLLVVTAAGAPVRWLGLAIR